MGIGLFGGGNSRTASTNTSTSSQVSNNNAGALGPVQNYNLLGNSGAVSIMSTDYGAISSATDLSKLALESGAEAFNRAGSQVKELASSVIDKTLSLANKNQTSETSQLQANIVKIVVALAVVAGIAYAVKAGK